MNYILQGAMRCKWFSLGGLTGTFVDKTEDGIKQFQEAAGLSGSNINGIATPLIINVLLNMDDFILVPSGDAKIRQIQQELNRDYHKWIGLKPTDDRYGRDTDKAIIYALQVKGGIDTPNGVLGPATQPSLPTLAPGSKNSVYVRIMQYSLYCIRYDPTGLQVYLEIIHYQHLKNSKIFAYYFQMDTVGNKHGCLYWHLMGIRIGNVKHLTDLHL